MEGQSDNEEEERKSAVKSVNKRTTRSKTAMNRSKSKSKPKKKKREMGITAKQKQLFAEYCE